MKYVVLIYNIRDLGSHVRGGTRQADGRVRRFRQRAHRVWRVHRRRELADPSNTKTVRVRGGVLATTDGPFAETKEQLAGYFVIDSVSLERAIEIAARDPNARFGAVEVRPIMDEAGTEM